MRLISFVINILFIFQTFPIFVYSIDMILEHRFCVEYFLALGGRYIVDQQCECPQNVFSSFSVALLTFHTANIEHHAVYHQHSVHGKCQNPTHLQQRGEKKLDLNSTVHILGVIQIFPAWMYPINMRIKPILVLKHNLALGTKVLRTCWTMFVIEMSLQIWLVSNYGSTKQAENASRRVINMWSTIAWKVQVNTYKKIDTHFIFVRRGTFCNPIVSSQDV